MKYKLPFNSALLCEAKLYAIESIEHTLNYKGWEDGHEKLIRITVGKCCQLWLSEFCRLNGIHHKKDDSSPYLPDNMDLEICGYKVDCKASYIPELCCQVTENIHKSNIDFYSFFLTDKKLSYISPLGMISKEDYLKDAIKVIKGDKIPGTNYIQRFDYSYFLNQKFLQGTIKVITNLMENFEFRKKS
jgi:hypothetical protein